MKQSPSKEDIRRLLDIDPNARSAVPQLSPKELHAREIAIATLQLVWAEGWRPNDARKLGGKKRAGQSQLPMMVRWKAIAELYPLLPKQYRDHPFSDGTLDKLHKQLADQKIDATISTIKADFLKLKIRKSEKTSQ